MKDVSLGPNETLLINVEYIAILSVIILRNEALPQGSGGGGGGEFLGLLHSGKEEAALENVCNPFEAPPHPALPIRKVLSLSSMLVTQTPSTLRS